MFVTKVASLLAKSCPFVSVPMTVLLFDLSAAGGVHGVAHTVTPRATASFALPSSPALVLVLVVGSMRMRCSERPAPVVVDHSVSASAVLMVVPAQAVDAPKPDIFC